VVDYIIDVDGAKVDAESRSSRIVRHGRVELRPREENHPTHRGEQSDLWFELDRLLWFWLFARIGVDVLSRLMAAGSIPF